MSRDEVRFDPPAIPETDDLQFGEVQTAANGVAPPAPDTDGHLAVRRVSRRGQETRAATEVFVDLDTMLDMQEHAAEDTSVELGGVLLGRRGTKPDGTPYVTICDSLRAKHYKATRGSFKFTHETWADISRRRAELPESTEIVGWYHTHPGWSVFLSDLDVFICDHFFSHPDDVALVIDPTSGDTGLFVRRGSEPGRPPRRLDHFFLHSHRKRSETLDQWAAYFSGTNTMSNPPAVFPGRAASPLIVTTAGDGTANSGRFALMMGGILGGQLALIAVMFYLVAARPQNPTAAPVESNIEVRQRILDDLIDKIAGHDPEILDQSYREMGIANAQLQATNLGLLARVEQLREATALEQNRHQRTVRELEGIRERLALAETRLADAKELADPNDAEDAVGLVRANWLPFGAGAGLGAILGAAGLLAWSRHERNDEITGSRG